MICGGMNGDENDAMHASNIADFALMAQRASQLVISPSDGQPIQLRVGIHSGPVAGGVVGSIMPRYCLFGRTVNIANRMEANGIASRIQCSNETANLLLSNDTHVVEPRGSIDVKGIGQMETSWLVGMSEEHRLSLTFDENEILDKCRAVLGSSSVNDLDRDVLSILSDKNKLDVSKDIVKSAHAADLNDSTYSLPNDEQHGLLSNCSSSDSLFLLDIGGADEENATLYPTSSSLHVLIVSDVEIIRLSAMHLLKDAFMVESNFVSVDFKNAIEKLRLDKRNFDVIVIEKNLYNNQDEKLRQEFRSLAANRDRLLIMVVPDFDPSVQNQSVPLEDSTFHHITFPLPSADQLKVGLMQLCESSGNSFIKKICEMPRVASYRKKDTTFRVLLVCNSKTAYRIMEKQLRTVLQELDIHHEVFVAVNGMIALDECGRVSMIDLIIIDNALKSLETEMEVYELLEFLRNQPITTGSLIIVLSKSSMTNTADLVNAGVDIVWPKPLPDKETLKTRLSRVCQHYKFCYWNSTVKYSI